MHRVCMYIHESMALPLLQTIGSGVRSGSCSNASSRVIDYLGEIANMKRFQYFCSHVEVYNDYIDEKIAY